MTETEREAQYDRVVRLWRTGRYQSYREVADKCGVSRSTVCRLVAKLDLAWWDSGRDDADKSLAWDGTIAMPLFRCKCSLLLPCATHTEGAPKFSVVTSNASLMLEE